MARSQVAIGTTQENMQYLFALVGSRYIPRMEFKRYARVVPNGNLATIGQGFSTTVWDWNVITATARNTMKGYCTGLSSLVYVRVYNDSIATPAWEVYRARMFWTPEAEDRQNEARLKLVINFRLLEQLAEL